MRRHGISVGFSSKLCVGLHSFAHWCLKKKLKPIARALQLINRLLTGADIDCGAQLAEGVLIPHTVGIVIGETSILENDVVLMPHVTLGATEHSMTGRRHPRLCEGAYIGAGAVIAGPVTVGSGATVGANAVVTKDVEPGITVVGIPARPVGAPSDGKPDNASGE